MSKSMNSKSRSMVVRIAISLLALVLLQSLVLSYLFVFSGIVDKIDAATYNALSNSVGAKKDEIEVALMSVRNSALSSRGLINAEIRHRVERDNESFEILAEESKVVDEVMKVALSQVTRFVRFNFVSGAFVILDSPEEVSLRAKPSRLCAYVRNTAPIINGRVENDSLLLEYGALEYLNEDIAVSSTHMEEMTFSGSQKRDFYFTPVDAAAASPPTATTIKNYGYWAPPFSLKDEQRVVMTYTMPLVSNDGELYGVFGFELDETCLQKLLPLTDAAYDDSFYMLGVELDGSFLTGKFLATDQKGKSFLADGRTELSTSPINEGEAGYLYRMQNVNYPENPQIGAFEGLSLYDGNSWFYGANWLLGYLVPENVVMAGSSSVKQAIALAVLSTVIIGLVLTCLIVVYIYRPIKMLAEKVRLIDPEKPVRLEKVGIREIDDLSSAFEILSEGVSKAASKMFGIIELVNMPIGSFEISHSEDTVRLSKSLFGNMDMSISENGANIQFTISEWCNFIDSLKVVSATESESGITETLYTTRGSQKKWLRMRMLAGEVSDMGVIIDVTDEISQKQRLEYERNSDPLTKLLNRRAFVDRAMDIIEANSDKICVLMFADLDGLKSINDLYGHDTGDAYIVAFARFLTRFRGVDADVAVGRMSGDEFVLLMGGFTTREEARAAFDRVFSGLENYSITAADGSSHTIRASAGIAYYPEDSKDINDLLKYSDYAMYEIKHTKKGEVREFDKESYNSSLSMANESGILNLLFEKKRVHFAFQPIVDAKTGEVYAYEALMRPNVREFKTPDEILNAARSQSKLYQVEKLTFDVMLDWLNGNQEILGDKKIFINSMPNQIFSPDDIMELREKYSHLYGQIVLDIIENKFLSKEETKKKVDFFRSGGSLVAIEDHGGSGNTGNISQFIKPDFIKLDKSIVRGIDTDTDKQQLVQSMIAYSSKRGMKLIAVGVETYEELGALINMGVDYVQGYYLSRPVEVLADIPGEIRKQIQELSDDRTA